MDPESVFIESATLVFDVCLFSLFYKLYKTRKICLKSLKEAQNFEINSELPEKVQSSGGVVPYAVVSGNVKALSTSLKSQYFSSVRGVIREKIIKERKVKWSPMLRMWSAHDNNIQHSVSSVPFAVCGKTNGLFKKQICVEIVDPLMAEELMLPTIYDEFTMHEDTIGEAVFSFFRGERTVGVQEIENMLMEDSTLTAVGKLIIDKGKVKIMPPDPDLNYFVTPLTLDSLIKKVGDSTRFHKIICIITGAIGVCLFAYIAKRGFTEIKQRINRAKRLKEMEEARRLRMMADSTRKLQTSDNNCSRCVVCMENPVEILITECGHACLCLNCSQEIRDLCPVCRSKIISFVQVFLP
ncbi:Mitochondrial ubiquitin ligase activator of nfkb 1, partial [Stegodyphus mimosarum]